MTTEEYSRNDENKTIKFPFIFLAASPPFKWIGKEIFGFGS